MDNLELPKRDDPIYRDIEKFKDYELTECIAYEMAIRNTENIQNVENFVRVFLSKDFIDNNYDMITEQVSLKESKEYSYKLTKNMIDPFILYLKGYPFFGNLRSFINAEKKKYQIEAKQRKEIYFSMYGKNNVNFDLEGRDFDKLFFYTEEYVKTDKLNLENKVIHNHLIETEFFTSYTRYIENKITNEDEIKLAEISPKYSRPALYIPFTENKKVKLNINLELPLKDLEDTIKRLKKEFDKEKKLTLCANEFNNIDVTWNDVDTKNILSHQTKMADLFFIYDCLKVGINQTKIRNIIFNYYADNGKDTKTMDPATLKKYKDLSIEYIDNKRYKELLTGIKIEKT